ncbi:MAG: DNA repair protein RecO [Candidatus Omnitrophota bacterium]|nr:MAG: DNA repair protein RecO [Candidatus Omnitrophota bacterium]
MIERPKMPILKAEAIVLNKWDFRETSLIVNFLTKEFGKVSGLLKGIRKEPKKFASTLEIFSHNDILFYQKRESTLHLVSQCDIRDNFNNTRSQIPGIAASSLMMELLDAIMPIEDPNEDVFNLALDCLKEINNGSSPEKITTIFKIKTLSLSGFRPNFDSCVSCQGKILGDSKFSLVLGGLLCSRCFTKDTSSRSVFRGTVASILHIERNDLKSNLNLGMNPQIKRELELILNTFLNFHLGRSLKSQKVANKLNDSRVPLAV